MSPPERGIGGNPAIMLKYSNSGYVLNHEQLVQLQEQETEKSQKVLGMLLKEYATEGSISFDVEPALRPQLEAIIYGYMFAPYSVKQLAYLHKSYPNSRVILNNLRFNGQEDVFDLLSFIYKNTIKTPKGVVIDSNVVRALVTLDKIEISIAVTDKFIKVCDVLYKIKDRGNIIKCYGFLKKEFREHLSKLFKLKAYIFNLNKEEYKSFFFESAGCEFSVPASELPQFRSDVVVHERTFSYYTEAVAPDVVININKTDGTPFINEYIIKKLERVLPKYSKGYLVNNICLFRKTSDCIDPVVADEMPNWAKRVFQIFGVAIKEHTQQDLITIQKWLLDNAHKDLVHIGTSEKFNLGSSGLFDVYRLGVSSQEECDEILEEIQGLDGLEKVVQVLKEIRLDLPELELEVFYENYIDEDDIDEASIDE